MDNPNRLSYRQVFVLLLTIAAMVSIPYIAVYIKCGDIPIGYFKYPPTSIETERCIPCIGAVERVPFNFTIYIIYSIIGILIILLYLFPSIYGFKKGPEIKEKYFYQYAKNTLKALKTKKKLPVWFWFGLIMWLVPLVLFSRVHDEPKWLLNIGLLPLFWGFAIMLDGIVFYINDGDSLISKKPTELVAIGVISISGWLFFDYLNFFIGRNWYYPAADLVDRNNNEFIVYAFLGSSGFIPMAFEWYYLLRKVKILNSRYKNGPKLKLPNWLLYILIIISLIGLAITPFHGDSLFFILWLGPLIILASVLTLVGIWTPFTSIKKGDWTALLTFALTYLIQGILLEWWNYMSGEHDNGKLTETYNPAYWAYSLPNVHIFPLFEMPLLGYGGYLFFSVHCYLWWIITSKLMGIPATFDEDEEFR